LYILDIINGRGSPKVTKSWFHDIANATTATSVCARGAISVVPNFGYQSGWWIPPRGGKIYQLVDDQAFTALGTYDQATYVIPGLNATIVYQSSFPVHHGELFYNRQEFATAIALALALKV
jgi:hypothetical protein